MTVTCSEQLPLHFGCVNNKIIEFNHKQTFESLTDNIFMILQCHCQRRQSFLNTSLDIAEGGNVIPSSSLSSASGSLICGGA